MMYDFSGYGNPLEDKYLPTDEEMEQERQRVLEWEEYQQDIGYIKNPYEIESREVSSKYEVECMTQILQQLQT
jgi:hypothetical protein